MKTSIAALVLLTGCTDVSTPSGDEGIGNWDEATTGGATTGAAESKTPSTSIASNWGRSDDANASTNARPTASDIHVEVTTHLKNAAARTAGLGAGPRAEP